MRSIEFHPKHSAPVAVCQKSAASRVNGFALFVVAVACLGAAASQASAATLSRSMVVQGTPAAVWSMIGPFCAIKDWLPPVGSCSEDGGTPPTRTLVTKDGKGKFVERQTARNDTKHFYTYTFLSSPLPVTHYFSTIEVTASGQDQSIVTWRGTYTPDVGKAKEANAALDEIYAAGLDSIKSRATQRLTPVAATGTSP